MILSNNAYEFFQSIGTVPGLIKTMERILNTKGCQKSDYLSRVNPNHLLYETKSLLPIRLTELLLASTKC